MMKKLAGIVVPFVSALGLLHLMGSDWYEGVVSTATEFVVSMMTGT